MKFPVLSLSSLAVFVATAVAAVDDASLPSAGEGHVVPVPALRGGGGGNDASDNIDVDESPSERQLSSVIATFYEHFHFQGRALTVTNPGYYGIDFLHRSHFNDIISSFRLAPGYAAKLCLDDGCYNPHDFVTAGSNSRFANNVNDKVSAFIIYQPAAVLYEDAHYSGRGLVALEAGHYDIHYFYSNHFNDLASSMVVAHGYSVTLCRHAQFVECKHEADYGFIPWFGHFNDQVSSFIVTRH